MKNEMDIFEDYKPLRNYMREFAAVPSLVHVWRFAEHLAHNGPLPVDPAPRDHLGRVINIRKEVFGWELEIVARELILNAGAEGDRTIGNWSDAAGAINRIRRLEEEVAKRYVDSANVLRELVRIAHRQFPWQAPPSQASLYRYQRIFGDRRLASVAQRVLGVTAKQFYLMGLAASGHFLSRPGIQTSMDFGVLGINRDSSAAFFDRIAASTDVLRERFRTEQSYDDGWQYTFNPLRATPLIRFDPGEPDRAICPLPVFLLHRVSDGVYYDLCREPDFDNAFGAAFQDYVGDVLSRAFDEERFSVYSQREYRVGKNRKDGVDWIVSDATANLFVECKTKRLPLAAKFSTTSNVLEGELSTLAGFIVQTYKNIADAQALHTAWVPDGKPIFPLVITLEPWWLFSRELHGYLENEVRQKLSLAGLQESLVEKMPYSIASIEEFEAAAQIMNEVSIKSYLESKTDADHREWAMTGFSPSAFRDEMNRIRPSLFEAEWDAMLEEIADLKKSLESGQK